MLAPLVTRLPRLTALTLADLDAIMTLERACFKSEPWTRRMYRVDLTENEMATYLALRVGNDILAYGGIWLMVDEAHIATIASHPHYRGCGLGLTLMLALLDAAVARGARLSTLEVRADNVPAQRLYLKLGYAIVGRRKQYYRDGVDGLIMTTPPLDSPAMQAGLAAVRRDAQARLERCFAAFESFSL